MSILDQSSSINLSRGKIKTGLGSVGCRLRMCGFRLSMATGTYLKYALGEKSDDIRWFIGSRYTLSENWALRLEYNHLDRDNDVLFSIQAFF